MPLYEFRCAQCGTTFEATQSMDEHARQPPPCPRCQSAARVEHQLSVFTAVTSRKA